MRIELLLGTNRRGTRRDASRWTLRCRTLDERREIRRWMRPRERRAIAVASKRASAGGLRIRSEHMRWRLRMRSETQEIVPRMRKPRRREETVRMTMERWKRRRRSKYAMGNHSKSHVWQAESNRWMEVHLNNELSCFTM